jgi:hypothetical protein
MVVMVTSIITAALAKSKKTISITLFPNYLILKACNTGEKSQTILLTAYIISAATTFLQVTLIIIDILRKQNSLDCKF